jgi:hypothetical protein
MNTLKWGGKTNGEEGVKIDRILVQAALPATIIAQPPRMRNNLFAFTGPVGNARSLFTRKMLAFVYFKQTRQQTIHSPGKLFRAAIVLDHVVRTSGLLTQFHLTANAGVSLSLI